MSYPVLLALNSTAYTPHEQVIASVSQAAGIASLSVWLFAQLPQVIENHLNQSVAGVSLLFLGCWIAGDVTNLIGCILTRALAFQTCLASYYCFIDLILSTQFWYYTRVYPKQKVHHNLLQSPNMLKSASPSASRHRHHHNHHHNSDIHGYSLDNPMESVRGRRKGSFVQKLFSASMVGFTKPANAAPIERLPLDHPLDHPLEFHESGGIFERLAHCIKSNTMYAFTVLATYLHNHRASIGRDSAWLCSVLYLSSRSPQIIKNFQNKSTHGISIFLFVFAMLGNCLYTISIGCDLYLLFCHQDEPGSNFQDIFWAQLPFIVGSSGTVLFDCVIILQWYHYRSFSHPTPQDEGFDHDLHIQRQRELQRKQQRQQERTRRIKRQNGFANSPVFDDDPDFFPNGNESDGSNHSFYTNHYNTYSHHHRANPLSRGSNINTNYNATTGLDENSSLLSPPSLSSSRVNYNLSPPPAHYISSSHQANAGIIDSASGSKTFISNTISALAKSLSRSSSVQHLRSNQSPSSSYLHNGSFPNPSSLSQGGNGHRRSSTIANTGGSPMDTSLIPSIIGNYSSISKKMSHDTKVPFSPIDFLHDEFHQPVSYGSLSQSRSYGANAPPSSKSHSRGHSRGRSQDFAFE